MSRWQVHRSRKDEGDVALAELVGTFDTRREAYEYVATFGLYEEYDYLVGQLTTVDEMTSTRVVFTCMGETKGEWEVDRPSMLPDANDRVMLDGQLWIVQQNGRRWHGPKHIEIVLSYKATTPYDTHDRKDYGIGLKRYS